MDRRYVSITIAALGLGCYTDDPDNRTLNEQMWREQPDMTNEWCATNCTRLEYPYFGLEYGRECKGPLYFPNQAQLRSLFDSADQDRFLWT